MVRDYKILFDLEKNYLFPYPSITKGSKVFIYGAGQLGKQIYFSIKESNDYEISGITDKNWKSLNKQGINAISPEAILTREFDYLIIPITYINVSRKIKNDLIKMGISKDKFADVDMNVFDEIHLPF